jgi:hypothetical protein
MFNLTGAIYQTYRHNDRDLLSNLHELDLIIKIALSLHQSLKYSVKFGLILNQWQ